MNFLKSFFTFLFVVSAATAVAQQTFKADAIYYEVLNANYAAENSVMILSGTGCTGDVVIPESVAYNGVDYKVAEIGSGAFRDCAAITSVEIPNSVTRIYSNAFYGCTSLCDIKIPETLSDIGYGVFENTAWYDGQPEGEVYIGNVLYKYKGVMPDNTTIYPRQSTLGIAGHALSQQKGLAGIVIPSGVRTIGYMAFYGCPSLTEVIIPNSVTNIRDYAFDSCTGIKNLIVGKNVAFDDGVFYNCTSVERIVSLLSAEKVKSNSKANDVFAGLKKSACTLCLPKGAREAYGTARVWSGFVNVEEYETFSGNCGLYSQSHWALTADVLTISGWDSTNGYNIPWDKYKDNIRIIVIENGVNAIGNNAFKNCSNLKNIIIPNSVTNIGYWAFYGCAGLTSVEIPNSITSIGEYAFSDCTGLTSVVIPNSVKSAGKAVFERCSGLKSAVIGNGLAEISNNMFKDCKNLRSVTIPNSVTKIGNYAFDGCTALVDITIPSSVENILDYAFRNTGWYNNQEDGLLFLNGWLMGYKGNQPTGDLVIADGVIGIVGDAFNTCAGITSVKIPEGVKYICGYAFAYCWNITSIEIPSTVTYIGWCAFIHSYSLTSLISHIPAENLFAIPSDDFKGVFYGYDKSGCTLYVPTGAKEAYASTEGWNEFTNIVEIEPEFTLGDINKDNEINVGDFAALANIIFNSENIDDATKAVADINGDGEVNVGDFAALVNLIFNSGSQAAPKE